MELEQGMDLVEGLGDSDDLVPPTEHGDPDDESDPDEWLD